MTEARHGPVHFTRPSREMFAGSLALFASIMMIIIGLFHIVVGLAAVLQSSFYVVAENYAFSIDVGAWGWVHLVLGVLVGLTGIFLMGGQSWARVVGIIIVGLSALGNFLFIPYQPLWSVLIIAVDVAVIWALTVHGQQIGRRQEAPSEQ
jgi:hypothetical protein